MITEICDALYFPPFKYLSSFLSNVLISFSFLICLTEKGGDVQVNLIFLLGYVNIFILHVKF